MGLLDRIFKKNNTLIKLGLQEAKEKGFITEEEFLRLEEHRATGRLEEYLKSKKSKK